MSSNSQSSESLCGTLPSDSDLLDVSCELPAQRLRSKLARHLVEPIILEKCSSPISDCLTGITNGTSFKAVKSKDKVRASLLREKCKEYQDANKATLLRRFDILLPQGYQDENDPDALTDFIPDAGAINTLGAGIKGEKSIDRTDATPTSIYGFHRNALQDCRIPFIELDEEITSNLEMAGSFVLHPFLLVEVIAAGESTELTELQCAKTAALVILKHQKLFLNLEDRKEQEGADLETFLFSMTISSARVRIFGHWADVKLDSAGEVEQVSYHWAQLAEFSMASEEAILHAHQTLVHIFHWACFIRKQEIRTIRKTLWAREHKRQQERKRLRNLWAHEQKRLRQAEDERWHKSIQKLWAHEQKKLWEAENEEKKLWEAENERSNKRLRMSYSGNESD